MPVLRVVRRHLGAPLVAVSAWALSACPSSPSPSPAVRVDAGVALVDDAPEAPLASDVSADPVGAVAARLPGRPGACAQVRSLRDRAEAEASAAAIRAVSSLPVEIVEKDLGERGVWYRLCVGDEPDEARLVAKATRWTAPDGVLAPFLDPPRSPDEARFLVLPRAGSAGRRPTEAQARAFLARSASGPAFSAGADDAPLLVGTATAGDRIVVVDAAGRSLRLDPAPAPGCASCAVAEQQSPIVRRRVLGAGDVGPGPGDEILIEEETAAGARFLAVVAVADPPTTLRRTGAVLLAQAAADVLTRGEAFVVEADGDVEREIAIARLELRSLGGHLCSLTSHAEIWGADGEAARGLTRLDVKSFLTGESAGVVDLITALDSAGDATAASSACAQALSGRPSSQVGQLCLQRIRSLVAAGRPIDAVNAAGAIAERAPALRAAVAGPLFSAMQALDADPRLSAAPWDCAAAPLVRGIDGKPVEEVIALARARLAERLSLSDIADAVFVTASRDFGTETPVFAIAGRWLERLRVTQPARHAAIEAALLPPSSMPAPTPTEAPVPDDGGPGFGGAP
jgi:hypothetical protein